LVDGPARRGARPPLLRATQALRLTPAQVVEPVVRLAVPWIDAVLAFLERRVVLIDAGRALDDALRIHFRLRDERLHRALEPRVREDQVARLAEPLRVE